jgi:hypothetical protein
VSAATVPTTLGGLLAELKYVEAVGEGKSGMPDEAFDEDNLKMILISAQDCIKAAQITSARAKGALDQMERDIGAVHDYATLLAVLPPGPMPKQR